jgi:anti-anti-sigma regulatory factor
MKTSACLLVDGKCPLTTLQEATTAVAQAEGELLLDFSAVQHIDAKSLFALEQLAEKAEQAKVAVVIRGVNVKIYKVLKLAGLASSFSFLSVAD